MWRGLCLSVICAALINADGFKRAEMSASPFVLSSRYGRSSPRMLTPRNDSDLYYRSFSNERDSDSHHNNATQRFFMTGRYGKRSGQDTEENGSANKKLNFGISELINTNERDRNRNVIRDRERLREMSQKWRPKCDCLPNEKPVVMLRNYYKRIPETLDLTSEEN